MTRSDQKSTEDIIKSEYYNELVFLLQNLNSEEKAKDFLLSVFTPTEAFNIAQRLSIVEYINLGYTHRKIAKLLHVSITTVSRASRQIKEGRFVRFYSEESLLSSLEDSD